jgi:hypothetical protein
MNMVNLIHTASMVSVQFVTSGTLGELDIPLWIAQKPKTSDARFVGCVSDSKASWIDHSHLDSKSVYNHITRSKSFHLSAVTIREKEVEDEPSRIILSFIFNHKIGSGFKLLKAHQKALIAFKSLAEFTWNKPDTYEHAGRHSVTYKFRRLENTEELRRAVEQ